MATVKTPAIVGKGKATAADKTRLKAQDAIVKMLNTDGVTAADITLFAEHLASIVNVLNQSGDGKGKRFSGAESHDYAHNADALVKTGSKLLATAK